jgi:hypothetical protein
MAAVGITVDPHLSFIGPAKQNAPEVDRPRSIISLSQSDVVLLERIGSEQQLCVRAGTCRRSSREVPRPLERRQSRRKRPP